MKRIYTLFLSIILVTSCSHKSTQNPQKAMASLDELYQKSTQTLFTARPAAATMLGIDTKTAGGSYNHRLADFSPESEERLRAQLSQTTDELKNIHTLVFDENKEVMQSLGRYFSGSKDFDIGYIDTWMGLSPFIINQINGPLIDVPNTLITNQQINSLEDAKDYIKRLDHYDLFVENVLAKMSADSDNNWTPPLVIVNKSIAAMKSFIKPAVNQHPFVTSFESKLKDNKTITFNDKKHMTDMLKLIVAIKVYPAYRNVITAL